jgi:GTPase SAR1 family protein
MAGSGKTTLIQRINSHLHQHQLPGYIINLDPAVTHLPYGANIDIRDTVRGVTIHTLQPQPLQ